MIQTASNWTDSTVGGSTSSLAWVNTLRPRNLEVTSGSLRAFLWSTDEEPILGLLSQVFQSAGYDVETRSDGASAVDALSGLGAQEFDLVVTDLVMPGLSGEAVLRAAKALEPAVPVLILTA